MTVKRAAFLLAAGLLFACRSSEAPLAPVPAASAIPAESAASSTTSGAVASAAASVPRASTSCPPPEAAERQHCVWLSPAPGVTGIVLGRQMKDAGFPAEVEGERVYAYWTPAKIETFFGKKPTYMKTGGGSGGTVCLLVMPKGARPVEKVRRMVGGWAIDDPVCEM